MIRVCIILFSFFALIGCKSRQKLQTNSGLSDNCKVALNSKADIIAHYDTSGLQFKWIKVKAKINTTKDEKGLSFTASFRIEKDSLIYASITKAGIPFAKLLLTKDSVKVVDLFHKKQKTGSFSELESLIGFKLSFNIMQKLLLGKPAFLYEKSGSIKSDSLVHYSNDSTLDGYVQRVSFPCDTIDLKSTVIEYSGKNIQIEYSNPKDINGYLLNKNITLTVKEAEKVVILAVIEITRVKKFNNLKIPFSIPADYERMD
tara:strand:- start:1623 stop:2399 length:777 start_codon:yes stop_codon:yes gene_type:complete